MAELEFRSRGRGWVRNWDLDGACDVAATGGSHDEMIAVSAMAPLLRGANRLRRQAASVRKTQSLVVQQTVCSVPLCLRFFFDELPGECARISQPFLSPIICVQRCHVFFFALPNISHSWG